VLPACRPPGAARFEAPVPAPALLVLLLLAAVALLLLLLLVVLLLLAAAAAPAPASADPQPARGHPVSRLHILHSSNAKDEGDGCACLDEVSPLVPQELKAGRV
jgi:hypothetical protein